MDERPVRARPSLVRLDDSRGVSFSGRNNNEDEKDKDEEKRRGAEWSRDGHFTSGRGGVFGETTKTGTKPRSESSPRARRGIIRGTTTVHLSTEKKENESFDESSTLLAKKTLGGRLQRIF